MKLIYGVGFNDRKYPAVINGVRTKEYMHWQSMLIRCYCEKYLKKRPTYKGCTVSENFKSYSYFYEWCQNQKGFDCHNSVLDKDLLTKGNKVYSEDTCVFIPDRVNSLMTKRERNRGSLPIGVQLCKESGKYRVMFSFDSKRAHGGRHLDPITAFNRYKELKELCFRRVAEEYRDRIDPRAYDALMNYRVEITD